MEDVFLVKYKRVLLATFKNLIDFFEANNLKWFANSGTGIGAVRHQNIIPWDDDVDIFMLREDYEKLLTLREELKSRDLYVETLGDENHTHSFTKIVNARTTVWENKSMSNVSGVWVDVFPLDYFDGGITSYIKVHKAFQQRFRKYQHCIQPFSLVRFLRYLLKLDIRSAFFRKQMLKSSLSDFCSYWESLQKKDGKNLVCYSDSYEACYNKEWFEDFILMPFSDFEVRMPKAYHECLTLLYGDYMTPPSPIPSNTHSLYYVNLTEKLSEDEIKEQIRSKAYLKDDNIHYGGEMTFSQILSKLKKR